VLSPSGGTRIEERIVGIVAGAAGLYDRVSVPARDASPPSLASLSDGNFRDWCGIATGNDERRFLRRFMWDRLDLEDVSRASLVCDKELGNQLPRWASELVCILEPIAAEETIYGEARGFVDPANPLPFEDLLFPFVTHARRRVLSDCATYGALTGSVRAQLERALLALLAHVAGQTFNLEFTAYRALRQFEEDPFRAGSGSKPGTRLYRAFVSNLLQDRLFSFFSEYPVLARLLSTCVSQWVQSTGEFVERFREDEADLRHLFGSDLAFDRIVSIETSISDRHNDGRTVAIVSFDSGAKLVYKPKPLDLDVKFLCFIDWANNAGLSVPLKIPRVLNRGAWGWAEYIAPAELPCHESTPLFYRRIGMLLCLAYILGEVDWHFENLIASGEHPVPVDFETLLHPRVQGRPGVVELATEVERTIEDLVRDSVLRTGLLPPFGVLEEDGEFDSSGLTGDSGQKTQFVRFDWKDVNTDGLELTPFYSETRAKSNLPRIRGEKVSPVDFQPDLIGGFTEMYELVLRNRDTLMAQGAALACFEQCHTRFVFRSSSFYSHILLRSLHPDYLRDGFAHSVQLDILSAALLKSNICPASWPALRKEHEALERLDIPLFRIASDSDRIRIGSGEFITNLVPESGFARLGWRVRSLGPADLKFQIGIIEKALHGREEQRRFYRQPSLSVNSEATGVRFNFARIAIKISEALVESSIPTNSGGVTWITPAQLPLSRPLRLESTGCSLYDGASGIAMFLAAAARASNRVDFAEHARRALMPLQQEIHDQKRAHTLTENAGIGGCSGVASIIYALVQIASLLNERSLLQDAEAAAALLTPDMISSCKKDDVVGGLAGAILGLLVLHRETAEAALIERALKCARQLLSRRFESDTGHRVWATHRGRCLTGFAHGAAGIGHALFQLAHATCSEELYVAAEDCFDYELSLFRPEPGNWLDLRYDSPAFAASWCHGAPGIAFSRMSTAAATHWSHAREDVEAAVAATLDAGLHPLDLVCCGNFGRIEFLLAAARFLNRPELSAAAEKLAAAALQRRNANGNFRIFADLPVSIDSPSLFCGLAGIGYVLLRLGGDGDLPRFVTLD
jgi:type 2 lantibiotic biosynthesis protein LanM